MTVLLQETGGGRDLNNGVLLHTSHGPPPGEENTRYCLLLHQESSQQIVRRVYFTPNCPKHSLLVSPTCLQNISRHWEKSVEVVRNYKFSFQLCPQNFSPALATHAKTRAVQSKLLESVPIHLMDKILAQYFNCERFLFENSFFCIDLKSCLTSENVEIFPLIRDQSLVYFYVETLRSEQSRALREDSESEGLIVRHSVTSLTQSSNIILPAPSESILSNFNLNMKKTPEFFQTQLDSLTLTFRRYQKSLETFPSKSGLKLVLAGSVGSGAELVTTALAKYLGLGYVMISARDLVGDTSGSSEALIRRFGTSLTNSLNLIIVITELDVVAFDKERNFDERAFLALQENLDLINNSSLLIGLCHDLNKLNPRLASLFLHHLEISSLTERDRRELLTWQLSRQEITLDSGVDLDRWAGLTSGFNLADLQNLIDYAEDEAGSGEVVTESDLTRAMTNLQAARSDSLGLARVPSVSWEEVGGLDEARQEVMEAVTSAGGELRRSGVLLYGPPGVGKTLLAKAVATESRQNFISVKGPELLNMYVGQSEENVRQVFTRAREAQPCVVFFDELDSLAPNRGKNGDSGGVMDRVVSALLTQLDSLQTCQVTVIAATNRPDLVDPALLRPGRCDRLVYLGVAQRPDQKLLILQALTGKMRLAGNCDLAKVSQILPPGLTGADISSVVTEAAMAAVRRAVIHIEAGQEDAVAGEVLFQDFVEAIENISPSVSPEEMRSYELLRQTLRK